MNDACISNIFIPSTASSIPDYQSVTRKFIIENNTVDVLLHVVHPMELSGIEKSNLNEASLPIIVVNHMDSIWKRIQQSTNSSEQFSIKYQLEKDNLVNTIISTIGIKGKINIIYFVLISLK